MAKGHEQERYHAALPTDRCVGGQRGEMRREGSGQMAKGQPSLAHGPCERTRVCRRGPCRDTYTGPVAASVHEEGMHECSRSPCQSQRVNATENSSPGLKVLPIQTEKYERSKECPDCARVTCLHQKESQAAPVQHRDGMQAQWRPWTIKCSLRGGRWTVDCPFRHKEVDGLLNGLCEGVDGLLLKGLCEGVDGLLIAPSPHGSRWTIEWSLRRSRWTVVACPFATRKSMDY